MTKVRAKGEAVRRYILENVEQHPSEIAKVTAEHFGITRQAVNKHLAKLTGELCLTIVGETRARKYKLCSLAEFRQLYAIAPGLQEDVIWRNDVVPALGAVPENVLSIWHYGFTEMFNNAIDHCDGASVYLVIRKNAVSTEMTLSDDGVGIFKKIQTAMNLLDERHAILELAKGKLTTDPENHTGEGVFFTTRMFDSFDILSGGVYFTHKFGDREDWVMEREKFRSGTTVFMALNNHTARTVKKVFDMFTATNDDYGFTKTIVPVKLAQYGNDSLISRSQAKRLLARVEVFKTVIFDFAGVDSVGQAFADEIFRVFANRHRNVELHSLNANEDVVRMIARAREAAAGFNFEDATSSGAQETLSPNDPQPFSEKE